MHHEGPHCLIFSECFLHDFIIRLVFCPVYVQCAWSFSRLKFGVQCRSNIQRLFGMCLLVQFSSVPFCSGKQVYKGTTHRSIIQEIMSF